MTVKIASAREPATGSMVRQLTAEERTTISNGLRVAAERFGEHVKNLGDGGSWFSRGSAIRLADQFTKQAAESLELAALIDSCETVTLTINSET